MKPIKSILLLLGLCTALATPSPSGARDELSGPALVAALRKGGYNVYFRHAATNWTQNDTISGQGDWTSCDPERMRQLSDEGRVVAQRIGRAIRRLEIPVGKVFSSQYCRTRETARHMDLGAVTPTIAIMNMRASEYVGGREKVIHRARSVLSTPPPAGTNFIFVAHGNLMRAVTGAYTGEAGAVVLFPLGDGEFRLVAQLAPEDWEQLAHGQP